MAQASRTSHSWRGVASVIAIRTLHQRRIDDFVIIEAQPELVGRFASATFGSTLKGKKYIIEKKVPIGYKASRKELDQRTQYQETCDRVTVQQFF